MNFQTAAIVAGAAFVLSFLAGLFGGVPFFDILVRALIWGGVGFGGSLGIETLLRSLVPDLFVPSEEAAAPDESAPGQAVNITLEEEGPRGNFIEEVDADAPAPRPRAAEAAPAVASVEAAAASEVVASATPGDDEEMPEIGSFLDAFKPGASGGEEGEAAASPEIGEYAPVDSGSSSRAGEVTIDGEIQDPAILAKAVQTVLKRDAQGN